MDRPYISIARVPSTDGTPEHLTLTTHAGTILAAAWRFTFVRDRNGFRVIPDKRIEHVVELYEFPA